MIIEVVLFAIRCPITLTHNTPSVNKRQSLTNLLGHRNSRQNPRNITINLTISVAYLCVYGNVAKKSGMITFIRQPLRELQGLQARSKGAAPFL